VRWPSSARWWSTATSARCRLTTLLRRPDWIDWTMVRIDVFVWLFICVVWCIVAYMIMLMYYLNTLKLISIGVSAKLWLGGVWFGGQQNARGVCAAHRTIDRSCCTLQHTGIVEEKNWNFFIVIVVIVGLFSETFGNLVRYFDWSTTCCSQSISFFFISTIPFFFNFNFLKQFYFLYQTIVECDWCDVWCVDSSQCSKQWCDRRW